MIQNEAIALVKKYQISHDLPDGFDADHSTRTSLQGDEFEVVVIRQNNVARISCDLKNGLIQNIDLI